MYLQAIAFSLTPRHDTRHAEPLRGTSHTSCLSPAPCVNERTPTPSRPAARAVRGELQASSRHEQMPEREPQSTGPSRDARVVGHDSLPSGAADARSRTQRHPVARGAGPPALIDAHPTARPVPTAPTLRGHPPSLGTPTLVLRREEGCAGTPPTSAWNLGTVPPGLPGRALHPPHGDVLARRTGNVPAADRIQDHSRSALVDDERPISCDSPPAQIRPVGVLLRQNRGPGASPELDQQVCITAHRAATHRVLVVVTVLHHAVRTGMEWLCEGTRWCRQPGLAVSSRLVVPDLAFSQVVGRLRS